jgi:hypothetical protein
MGSWMQKFSAVKNVGISLNGFADVGFNVARNATAMQNA